MVSSKDNETPIDPALQLLDASGKLIEGTRHAGVRIGTKQDFARASVAFLGQGGVAHTGIIRSVLSLQQPLRRVELPLSLGVVDDVVEVGQLLFARKVAQDVHVAIGHRVGGEDVVVGDDDDALAVGLEAGPLHRQHRDRLAVGRPALHLIRRGMPRESARFAAVAFVLAVLWGWAVAQWPEIELVEVRFQRLHTREPGEAADALEEGEVHASRRRCRR